MNTHFRKYSLGFPYNHMSYQGLTFRQLFIIGDELTDELTAKQRY
jgi:hypothetical protein